MAFSSVNVGGVRKELAPAGDLGANLAKDPGLEAGSTVIASWTGYNPSAPDPVKFPPPFWARGANQSSIHITHDTTEHHSGSASVKMNYTGTSATSAQFMNFALHAAEGIKPSTTYRVSGWIKIPVGEKATLFAKRESMGSQTEARPHMITGDGQWHRQEYFVTTTPTNPVVALQAWIEAPAAGKNVWVDDVEVFEQSVPAFVNVGGAWKPAAEGWVNVAGVWKKMWPLTAEFNNATGGTVSEVTISGKKYRIHEFTATGQFHVVSGSQQFEYLIIGGAGHSGPASPNGAYHGASGGAGGMLEGTFASLPAGDYAVSVGKMGATWWTNGQDTTFNGGTGPNSAIAHGGGYGGGNPQGDVNVGPSRYGPARGGGDGASGGGGGGSDQGPGAGGRSLYPLEGHDGIAGWFQGGGTKHWQAGAGGGAGSAGGRGASTPDGVLAVGGSGRVSNIFGTPKTYSAAGGAYKGADGGFVIRYQIG